MHEIERIRVLDIPVDDVNMEGALSFVDEQIQNRNNGGYILAVNPEKVFALRKRPFLKPLFEHASLLVPDGMGIVLAARVLYNRRMSRVPGADLMWNICANAQKNGYRVFLYGATEEVNRKAVENLKDSFPGMQIAGRSNGYVDEDQMDRLIEQINKVPVDILFVGLGSPRQEMWIHEYLPRLDVEICQGIGGTLDTVAGNVKRAPKMFQDMGLEWFYRLAKDPRRFRRQLALPAFAVEVLKERLRHRVAV
jgi:N-acetylglucosaminyldiphosphoundecaprenol N-acetyl-beta-D-mannosaminyltransferase